MRNEQGPSPEVGLAERIHESLLNHYNSVIGALHEEREKSEELISIDFHDFDKSEAVKSFLESQGINTAGLRIETSEDHEEIPKFAGADIIVGRKVEIYSGAKRIFSHVFVSPDDEYGT